VTGVTGLYTYKDIAKGEFITWYTGEAYSNDSPFNVELAEKNES
jgi:hypothetical protein